METLIIISHEVKNYEDWKRGFDEGATMRDQAGIKLKGIYRGADNANMLTVITSTTNIEAAKAMLANPELKAGMEKAGVISAPDIKIVNSLN